MKRYIHLLWFVLLTACSAKHQPLRLEPNRVLFHSSEVGQVSTTPTDSIKWIRPIAFSRGTLKIRYADGHDTRVAKNTGL